MNKGWLRVSECVTVDMAAQHLESLGYKNVWGDFRPESPNAIVGERNGEISWDTDLDFLFNDGYEEIFIPATKHKHYDLIVAWAGDPSQKVWYKGLDDWRPVEISPSWRYEYDWYIGEHPPKRKIMIGDVEIDAHEIESPRVDTEYFVPNVGRCLMVDMIDWRDSALDRNMLKRGLIHLNKEAAIAHAKALIKVSGGCVDE